MANVLTRVSILVVGAGSATLATAVSNYNTAIASAITTASGVTGVQAGSIQVNASGLIFDGTLYVGYGSVTYTTITVV